MTLKHRNRERQLWAALWVAWLITAGSAWGQNVILHLRNGDRIAGTILAETNNQVTVSAVWNKALLVPADQIERREIVPAPAVTNAAKPVVSAPVAPTNAVAAAKPIPVIQAAKPAPPPKTSWHDRLKGEVALGTDSVFGATDRQMYYARASLTYAQPYKSDPKEFFRDVLSYSAEYGRSAGVLSANKMDATSKTDFDLHKKIYIYNLAGIGYDEVRLIDLRYEEGPGMGYHLLTLTNFVLNTEVGADYQVEERSDHTLAKNFYGRFAENFTWKIAKQMTLTEKLEFFPNAENYGQFRARFESNLSYALILNLSLNLTVLDSYDTRPAAGIARNELEFRTSVGIKF